MNSETFRFNYQYPEIQRTEGYTECFSTMGKPIAKSTPQKLQDKEPSFIKKICKEKEKGEKETYSRNLQF